MRIYSVHYKNGKVKEFYSLTRLWQSEPTLSKRTLQDLIERGVGTNNIEYINYSSIKEKQEYIVYKDGKALIYKSLTMVRYATKFTNETIANVLKSGKELNGFTIDIL